MPYWFSNETFLLISSCPVGFTGLRCDNNTGIILSYPVLSDNNYGWIAGLMTIIVLTIIATLITIYCCKRKRYVIINKTNAFNICPC